jgi:hypothetical protein
LSVFALKHLGRMALHASDRLAFESKRVVRLVDVRRMLIGALDRLAVPNSISAAHEQVECAIEANEGRRLGCNVIFHLQDGS